MTRISTTLVASAFAVSLSAVAGEAHAQSIIKNPGDHPPYSVELEPHLAFGLGGLYAGSGLGLGARVGIQVMDTGFVSTINDSVAISLGLDWLRYSRCYYVARGHVEYGCGASYFVLPVTLQWNFWFTPKFSLFGEPGLYIYHGVFEDYCRDRFGNDIPGCGYPTRTGVDLALFIGGRLHFNDTLALTLRLGWPTSSLGLTILF
jgi:hypothetical protein